MPKIMLIFNPNADQRRSEKRFSDLRALVDQFGDADWHGSEYPTHATQLAAEAGLHGYRTVIAIGGDGTVHEVINGLMKIDAFIRPALGVVPLGSGNDFAGGIGLLREMEPALRRALGGQPRPVDVGLIQDDHDRHEYFCNTAGFGLEGLICIQSRKLSHLQGYTMYLTATVQTILRDFKPIPMQITYDGGVIQRKLSMLTVTNGPRVGGGFRTTPAAIFDDGALDFLCANAVSRLRMAYLLTKLMRGTHTKDRAVQLGRTTHLNVQAEAPLAIHLDGEIFASPETNVRQADIKVIPGGIQLLR